MMLKLIRELGFEKMVEVLSNEEIYLKIDDIDTQLRILEENGDISFQQTIEIYSNIKIYSIELDKERPIEQKMEILYQLKKYQYLEILVAKTLIMNETNIYAEKYADVVPIEGNLNFSRFHNFNFKKVFPEITELSRRWYHKLKQYIGIIAEYGDFSSRDIIDFYPMSRHEIKKIIDSNLVTIELIQKVLDCLDCDLLKFILNLSSRFNNDESHYSNDIFSIPYCQEIVETIFEYRHTYWGTMLFICTRKDKYAFMMSDEMIKKYFTSKLKPETELEVKRYVEIFHKIPKGCIWKETMGYQYAYRKGITIKSGPPNILFTLKPKFIDDEGNCDICYDICYHKLSCGHYFHPECYLQWNDNCSSCNQEVDREIVKKYN